MADGTVDPASKVHVAKNAAELQKIRLEKLMKNPSKPVFIPEPSKEYKPREPLEFIRNVWGSSAGAGSGDFHVYRGVRRREYARQKYMKEKTEKEEADEAYHQKVLENEKAAEERTSKKRAKRLKKKQKQRNSKKQKKDQLQETSEEEEGEEEKKKDEASGKKDTINSTESDSVSTNTVLGTAISSKQQCKEDSASQGESVEPT